MYEKHESERREFVRVDFEVPVSYKFISKIRDYPEMEKVYEGSTRNISAGGLLLAGPVPSVEWTHELLMEKITIGVNIFLPNSDVPLKALTRVSWMEHIEAGTKFTHFGLMFKEIEAADRDRIFSQIIRSQI